MKTIKDVRKEITEIIIKNADIKIAPDDVIDKCEINEDISSKEILSIVIGEEERECPVCRDFPVDSKAFPDLIHNRLGINCKGTGKIKHPVTIRDAIEERRKR